MVLEDELQVPDSNTIWPTVASTHGSGEKLLKVIGVFFDRDCHEGLVHLHASCAARTDKRGSHEFKALYLRKTKDWRSRHRAKEPCLIRRHPIS